MTSLVILMWIIIDLLVWMSSEICKESNNIFMVLTMWRLLFWCSGSYCRKRCTWLILDSVGLLILIINLLQYSFACSISSSCWHWGVVLCDFPSRRMLILIGDDSSFLSKKWTSFRSVICFPFPSSPFIKYLIKSSWYLIIWMSLTWLQELCLPDSSGLRTYSTLCIECTRSSKDFDVNFDF